MAVFQSGLKISPYGGPFPREPCPYISAFSLFRKVHLGAGLDHTTHLSCVSPPAGPFLHVWGSMGPREKEEPQHALGVEGSRGADLLRASFPVVCLLTFLISDTGRETEARGNLWYKPQIPECW